MLGLSRMAARVDVLGCNVYGSDEGKQLVEQMEKIYSVNIAASDDITHASDLVLESDDIDVSAVRFCSPAFHLFQLTSGRRS